MEQNKAERLNENVTEKMCSSDGNVVGEMCSPADADTCGDGCLINPKINPHPTTTNMPLCQERRNN